MAPRKRIAIVAAAVIASTAAGAFDLQGHRGARGLAPENTIVAFTKALSVGVTTLELDLSMTKDGVLVVHHDPWLNTNTTRDASGTFLAERGPAIRALTLAEVRRYDVGRLKPGTRYAETFREQQPADGTRIPTLAEVFDLVAGAGADHIRFNIETKLSPTTDADTPDPDTFAQAVAAAVRQAGLEKRVTVQSFDWRTLAALRRIAPEIARVCLSSEGIGYVHTLKPAASGPSPWTGLNIDDFGGSPPKLIAAAGCAVWSPFFRDLTADRVTGAKRLGLAVIPWTVNDRANAERLLDIGVDGIITDYPDRLRAVLAARGIPLPPSVAVR
jgi:glycerophosphoryl diester phosphodiesterase